MMKILFLHPNFPGQFVRPALKLAQQGEDVLFLCQNHYGRTLPGVKRIKLKESAENEKVATSEGIKNKDTLLTAMKYKVHQ